MSPMPAVALHIRRALRLMESPKTVYSALMRDPTQAHSSCPVVTPMQPCPPTAFMPSTMDKAAYRTGVLMGLARQPEGTDAQEALLITAELQEAARNAAAQGGRGTHNSLLRHGHQASIIALQRVHSAKAGGNSGDLGTQDHISRLSEWRDGFTGRQGVSGKPVQWAGGVHACQAPNDAGGRQ
ncbi:MAG: hypothetical protein FRX49_04625 [Trebouxia sp. A1-2]|nr:MAG: hypothetical protein FRX49_04625 [Trebouxia sp. A1-2]